MAVKTTAVPMLNEILLPKLFKKIEKFDVPAIDFNNRWFGVNMSNIEAQFPIDDRNIQKMLDIKIEHQTPQEGGVQLLLSAKAVPFVIDGDFDARFTVIKDSGKIQGKFEDIRLDILLNLETQDADYNEKAPELKIQNMNFQFDQRKSNIKITGGFVGWMVNAIESVFQREIFHKVVTEAKTYLTKELNVTLNEELKEKGTFYSIMPDFGIDIAQTENPTIDNSLFEFFFNGSFWSQKNTETFAATIPEDVKLLDMSDLPMSKDVMIAINEAVPLSALSSLFTSGYKWNLSQMHKDYGAGILTADDWGFCDYIGHLCDVYDPAMEIDASIEFVDEKSSIQILEDQFVLKGDVRIIVKKADDGLLLADFTMVGIDCNATMFTNSKRAIDGQIHTWQFDHGVVNTPTTLVMTERDVSMASNRFRNRVNDLNGKFGNWKIKTLFDGLIMTNFFELKFDGASKTALIGFDIDPIFVGLPNQYHD